MQAKPLPQSKLTDPIEFYQAKIEELSSIYGANSDWSRADWMVVNQMWQRGYERSGVESESKNNGSEHFLNRFYSVE